MQRAEPPGEAHRAPQFRRRTAGVRPGFEIGVAQAREYSRAVVPGGPAGGTARLEKGWATTASPQSTKVNLPGAGWKT